MKNCLLRLKNRIKSFSIMARWHLRTTLADIRAFFIFLGSFIIQKDEFADCKDEFEVKKRVKELSDKDETTKEIARILVAKMNLVGETALFKINILCYANQQSLPSAEKTEIIKSIYLKRDKAIATIDTLSQLGVKVPPELKKAIMAEDLLEKITDLESAQKYNDYLDSLVDQIIE